MLNEALVPSRIRPATTPRSCCTTSTPVSSSRTARAAWPRSNSPARVGNARLPTRSRSGTPSSRSRCRTCMLTAGCVRCSSRAAREKEPWRATASRVWSCARLHRMLKA